jgi:ribosome modulation factor
MHSLSNLQKREIAIAARRAYDAKPDREAFEAINSDLSRSDCFNAWRHVEQGKAVGIQSLTEMTQAHYGKVLAHFQRLAGNLAAADHTLARDADNGRRVARFKLDEALRERGLSEGYAASICRSQNRCTLDHATEKQLWRVFYTVRNRRPALSSSNGPALPKPAAAVREPDPF